MALQTQGTQEYGTAADAVVIDPSTKKISFRGTAKITHHEQLSVAAAITSGASTTTYGIAGGLLANANTDVFFTSRPRFTDRGTARRSMSRWTGAREQTLPMVKR